MLKRNTSPLLLFLIASSIPDLIQLLYMPDGTRISSSIDLGMTVFLLVAIIVWMIFGSRKVKAKKGE
ncbi:MAG TPA: hypothetical protein VMU25_00325 [Candidatus Paceibacterota bacterium]|nr:hypothetical protein [Candidatus Paceibacterota bacterium]